MTPNTDSASPSRRPRGLRAQRPARRHFGGGGQRVHRDGRAGRLLARRQCTGGAGVLGHGALRDGRVGAGGLSRPAAHERRPHPDRQGLPVLRRPPDDARCARSGATPPGVAVLRPGARRDRDRARAGHRPALRAHVLRRGRGRPLARDRPRSARSSWWASRRCTRCWSSCSPTAPSRSARSTSRARSPRTCWRPRAPSSPPTWWGGPWRDPGRRPPAGRGRSTAS